MDWFGNTQPVVPQARSGSAVPGAVAGATASAVLLTRTQKWTPRCLPTWVPGFDNLIKGETEVPTIKGGLPLGSPSIVLFSGSPGTGKSTTCYSIVAQQLNHNKPVIFITFEKAPQVVMSEIGRVARAMELQDVKIRDTAQDIAIDGLSIMDMFSQDFGRKTIPMMIDAIQKWFTETKGRLAVIDSITDMTGGEALPEAQLRIGLKNFIVRLAHFFQEKREEICIVATSQHRGSRADSGIAGGMAVGHRSNAILNFDSGYVNQFDKGYYGMPRGTQVRSVWVVKTADYAHSPYEHYLQISPEAIVSVGEAIQEHSSKCQVCERFVESGEDLVRTKEGVFHVACYEKRNEAKSSLFGLGKDAVRGMDKGGLGSTPIGVFTGKPPQQKP